MRHLLIFIFCAIVITSIGGCCGKKAKQQSTATGDAAMVNSLPITMAELDDASQDAMQKVQSEIYKIKKRQLDVLIEEKLIETAAAAKGMTKEEYINAEVTSNVTEPSDNEIKAMYEARKDSYKEPLDKAKVQIANYLKQNRENRLYRNMITKLRGEADVKILLQPPRVEIDLENLSVFGEDDAPVTIVEFSDYECPFCKRVRPTIWKLTEDYKDRVRYVFVDFPLSFHKKAQKAHEAARCAEDQGKYYEYNRKLFDNQKNIGLKDLKKYAKELGLDTKKFDNCLDGGEKAAMVKENIQKGANAGVSGTPAFFINGIMLSGARPHSAFVEIIEEELAR